jgi:hypothetical protein
MVNFLLYFKISVILFFVVGVIGNGINVFIFSQKKFRKEAMFRYLIICAITNTLNLFMKFPTTFLYQDFFQVTSSGASCKLTYFFANVLPYTSSWMLVLSSLDRLVSIKYPDRFLFKNKLKFQILVVCIIFLVFVCMNIPYLIFKDVISFGNNNVMYCENVEYDFNSIAIHFGIIFQVILPFIIESVSSILLGYFLIKLKKTFHREYKKEAGFVLTIISMDTFNFLTCMPFYIFGYIQFYFPNYLSINFLIAMDTLQSIYYSIQFFIYLLSSKIFRAQFLSSFLCWKPQDQNEFKSNEMLPNDRSESFLVQNS